MRKITALALLTALTAPAAAAPDDHGRCRPIPLERVRLAGFLGRRVDRNVRSMVSGLKSPIPAAFESVSRGEKPVVRRGAADKDVHNWIEGASYAVAYGAPEDLRQGLERMTALVLKQQRPDGYITSIRASPAPAVKAGLNSYVAGHFFEAAVAHHRAVGRKDVLDAACRWADWLIGKVERKELTIEEFTRKHQEVELAMVRLYEATGRERYLEFARALVRAYGFTGRAGDLHIGETEGHAVRLGYLLAAAAELYLQTGDREFLEPLPPLWDELVSTRLYVTGGTGRDEKVSRFPFDLPQAGPSGHFREIAETCGSVAMMLFTQRMHRITGESRCVDVLENVLYNSFLGALSLDQQAIFYFNPLRVGGDARGRTDLRKDRTRRTRLPDLHRTSCCLPNCWRFLAALPECVFSADREGIRVNLYTSATAEHVRPDGAKVKLTLKTAYPHEGRVAVRVDVARPVRFVLRMRVPGWCRAATLKLPEGERNVPGGRYARIDRLWKPADEIVLDLDLSPRMLFSDARITANAGAVAFARGPLVYCLEQEDSKDPIERFRATVRAGEEVARRVVAEWRPDLLEGVYVLRVPGVMAPAPRDPRAPYFEAEGEGTPATATLVPFYARANRRVPAHWVTLIPRSPGLPGDAPSVAQPPQPPFRTEAYVSGREGYFAYRIPALLATPKGTLLAFAEGRKTSLADLGNNDMVLKRSTDGGKTWGPLRIIHDDGEATIGNPTPVVDRDTGRVWLIFGREARQVLTMSSDDDGRTWTDPVDITAQVTKPEWKFYGVGPGVGVQLREGKHRGRIVIPAYHRLTEHKRSSPYAHVFTSDDHGRTWKVGGSVGPEACECQVAETAGGGLVLNARNHWARTGKQPARGGKRIVARSTDGGGSWSEPALDAALIEPTCQASLLRYSRPGDGSRSRLLFANPAAVPTGNWGGPRHQLTVRLSYDDGRTWPVSRLIEPGPAAYSSLARLPDGRIGVLYESGGYKQLTFAAFDLKWLGEE